jgi:hypothetical protein
MSIWERHFCGVVLGVAFAAGCVHIDAVQVSTIKPTYVRPEPPARAKSPLVLVYDPKELPEPLVLVMPAGVSSGKLYGAKSLVTEHLRSALESLFEQVSVVTDRKQAPANAVIGTVHFIELGLELAPGGKTLVGELEWSLTLLAPSNGKPFYHWGERAVGAREGAGSFGFLDPKEEVRGAIEASLRALLKDMDTKNVIELDAGGAGAPVIERAASGERDAKVEGER